MSFKTTFLSRLNTSTAIGSIGYWNYAATTAGATYIVCNSISAVPLSFVGLSTKGDTNARVQVDIFADNQATLDTTADTVRGLLHCWRSTTSTPKISGSILTNEQDLTEQPEPGESFSKHRLTMDYSVWFST